MAFPRAFCKVVFSGTLLNGREIWSTSLSLDADVVDDRPGSLQDDLLPALVTAGSEWIGDPAAAVHNTAQLRLIKANMVGTDGRYASDSETYFVDIAEGTVRGGSSSNPMPPQATAAVSLLTGRSRGPGSRGRMFPPALAATIDPTTGGLSSSVTANIAAAAAGMLNKINAVPGYTVCVASEVRDGALEPVTRVSVGSVVDTQRRRRNSLPEVYSNAPVAGG